MIVNLCKFYSLESEWVTVELPLAKMTELAQLEDVHLAFLFSRNKLMTDISY